MRIPNLVRVFLFPFVRPARFRLPRRSDARDHVLTARPSSDPKKRRKLPENSTPGKISEGQSTRVSLKKRGHSSVQLRRTSTHLHASPRTLSLTSVRCRAIWSQLVRSIIEFVISIWQVSIHEYVHSICSHSPPLMFPGMLIPYELDAIDKILNECNPLV
jgi:hypothetical protein